MFFFSRISSWLAFFPQLSVPSKSKKNHGQRRKNRWLKPITLWSGKLWKWALRAFELPGQLDRQNRVTRGTIAAASVLNEVEKMTSWQVQHGVIMEGACWGFKKTCLFFYLSCFKFALVRIWSQNLPVKIGHSHFFWGKSACKVTNQNQTHGHFTGRWITRVHAIDSSRLKKRHPDHLISIIIFQNSTF